MKRLKHVPIRRDRRHDKFVLKKELEQVILEEKIGDERQKPIKQSYSRR